MFSVFFYSQNITMYAGLAVILAFVILTGGVSVEGGKWEDGDWVYDNNAECTNTNGMGTTDCHVAWKDAAAACKEAFHDQSQFQGYIKRDGCTFSIRFCCSTGSF